MSKDPYEEWRKFLNEAKATHLQYPLQLFASVENAEKTLKKFKASKRVEPEVHLLDKPMNGFWTSTAIKKGDSYTSEWIKFSAESGLRIPKSYLIVKAKPEAKIFVVDSEKDYKALVGEVKKQKTPSELRGLSIFEKLNWDVVAKKYDAVRITKNGVEESREKEMTTGKPFLYGWDVESTCWFDPTKLEVVGSQDITKKE